jgi:hypothetical protein
MIRSKNFKSIEEILTDEFKGKTIEVHYFVTEFSGYPEYNRYNQSLNLNKKHYAFKETDQYKPFGPVDVERNRVAFENLRNNKNAEGCENVDSKVIMMGTTEITFECVEMEEEGTYDDWRPYYAAKFKFDGKWHEWEIH